MKVYAAFISDLKHNFRVYLVDRHDLGEFYTPDWLCERILNEALLAHKNAKSIPRIADITCGSGSFLRVAIKAVRTRFLASKRLNKVEQTEAITNSIVGFEIHPLAAFIAKTNYLLAIEDLLDEADRPYSIPIYLCDSLLDLEGKSSEDLSFPIQVANCRIDFPLKHAMNDERFDALIDYIDKITHKFKKSELGEDKLEALISKELTKHLDPRIKEFGGLLDSLVKLAGILHDLVLNHENTIWSFVIKNNYRPVVFKQSFDLIVGNPPWLSFRYVKSEEYKTELEKLGLGKYKIAPQNGKLRTHMELATIFLVHAIERYLKPHGMIYFVLPRGIFSSDHHANFREQKHTVQMRIEEMWDLFDVEPLFSVPSCVVVASRNDPEIDNQFNGRVLSGKLPSQNVNWDVASGIIKESKTPFYLVKMNDRTALSPINQSATSNDTYYIQKFKQGATILPRNYYFVDTAIDFMRKKIVPVKTCETTRRNSKAPYKDVNLTGKANTDFLFHSVLAENIVPFVVIDPFVIHLPVRETGGHWAYLSSSEMLNEGYSDSSDWFSEVEKSYDDLSSNKMTLFERVNYHNGLLVQNPKAKIWVLYCASGTNACASVYENEARLWVEHKVYWHVPAEGRDEAFYLCAVLNSPKINELIKPFQSKGLLGERDIEKKILDVGIPKFDRCNDTMIALSQLGVELSKRVSKSVGDFTGKGIGKKRSDIRKRFQTEFNEIDDLVMKLFKH